MTTETSLDQADRYLGKYEGDEHPNLLAKALHCVVRHLRTVPPGDVSGEDQDGPRLLYEFMHSRSKDPVGIGWGAATPWHQLTGSLRNDVLEAYGFIAGRERERHAGRVRELDAWAANAKLLLDEGAQRIDALESELRETRKQYRDEIEATERANVERDEARAKVAAWEPVVKGAVTWAKTDTFQGGTKLPADRKLWAAIDAMPKDAKPEKADEALSGEGK